MSDETPSNGVLLAKLEAMSAVVLANQTTNHEAQLAIIAQTSKTNGRVTALEKTKNMFMGALIFMNVIVVPIAVAAIIKYVGLAK
ncbi:MAG: hypothetical protein WC243_03850 [Patescibacteria group bacterium]|jgi:hypothetical protein